MFEIFGINFFWYGLLIGLGVLVAYEIVRRYGKIDEKILDQLLWWVLPAGIIGARAYHVIDFWERYYAYNRLDIFKIWNGGLGIWGAIIFGVVALFIFSHLKKLNFLNLFNSVAIGMPFAQAIGRLGNWTNGELYGKNGEPLFAYEAILNVLLGLLLIYLSRYEKFTGGVYLVGYGVIRIVLENFRPDEMIWKIDGVPMAIIFGLMAIFIGSYFIFLRKRS